MKKIDGKYIIKFRDGSEKTFNSLVGANLSKADLRNTDLSNDNLYGANLSTAYLRYADLSNADLRYVNLYNADLSNADLSNADLRNAYLRYADLSETKGIISFTSEKHLAVYFKYKDVYYIKIGCKTLEIKEWSSGFEEIGTKEGYTQGQIDVYGSFIKMCNKYEL